jgi:hypothetical protein
MAYRFSGALCWPTDSSGSLPGSRQTKLQKAEHLSTHSHTRTFCQACTNHTLARACGIPRLTEGPKLHLVNHAAIPLVCPIHFLEGPGRAPPVHDSSSPARVSARRSKRRGPSFPLLSAVTPLKPQVLPDPMIRWTQESQYLDPAQLYPAGRSSQGVTLRLTQFYYYAHYCTPWKFG